MDYQTASTLMHLPCYVDALTRHFGTSSVFTSRAYNEVREQDWLLPTLSTLCKNDIVKIAKKEKFEITLYTFEFKHRKRTDTKTLTRNEAIKRGLNIEDACYKETQTGVRFYYRINAKTIKSIRANVSVNGERVKEYKQLTAQIKGLEEQLKQLRAMRQDI